MTKSNNIKFIDLDNTELENEIIRFLNLFGNKNLLGKGFLALIKADNGEKRYNNLLKATGYEKNSHGFISEIKKKLKNADGNIIKIGNVLLPYHFLFFILERIMPGNGYITIKDVKQLEDVTNTIIPEEEREDLQKVIEKFPVRFSFHIVRQMRLSKFISYQYYPFVDELNKTGLINTWVGQFHQGPLEQIYQNRPIFVLNMGCPTYCRFCFRKHKECRNQPSPTIEDVKEGFKYIERQKKIKEIVLTGGDPFMNKATMQTAVEEAIKIKHLNALRIATRSIAYYPHLFYKNDKYWLEYLKRINIRLQQLGKKLEVATHFLHPDEISFDGLNIISELVSSGIAVYSQTPFLKDCNDNGPELEDLYNALRAAGAEIHYIYLPCTPLKGNRRYVSTISSGLNVARYLSANVSERAVPKLCTATAIGKIDWYTSGWAVERDNENFTWIRTPYTLDYFKEFCPEFTLDSFESVKGRENKEGTIDITFMVKPGDDNILLGPRKPIKDKKSEFNKNKLKKLQKKILYDQRNIQSVFSAPKGIYRRHKTRIEIDMNEDIDFEFIKNNTQITDVIISSENDPIDNLLRLEEILKELSELENISSIRIRSLKFNYAPEEYGYMVINKLAEYNKVSLFYPKRIEIETQFLHSSEAKKEHKELVRRLNNQGITVYNNTPILKEINDDLKEIEKIANHIRNCGIEFNLMYLNSDLIKDNIISLHTIYDISSNLRKNGSGREIPRYYIKTKLGAVIFGIGTEFFRRDNKIYAKLLSYTIDDLKQIDKDFTWEDIKENNPVVEIKNIKFDDDFLLKK
ncbi:MAG: radical SAM protein [Nanoarchaeota archaeon]